MHVRTGAFLCHQGPRGVSGAFADVSGARNSPRRSPCYHLTTLAAGVESMCVRATSVGRASGTRLVPAEPGYPGNGNCRYPFKEILMKRKLHLALWIIAAILAVVFLVASSTKLFVPKEKLAGMGGAASRWVEDFSPGALKAIGALEFLAAVGLIMPAAVGIAPVLVPLAATGAVLLFAGAAIMRLRRGERATIIGDLVYLAMAAFVAWGRFSPGSFTRQTQRDVFSRARPRRIAPGGLPDRGRLVP